MELQKVVFKLNSNVFFNTIYSTTKVKYTKSVHTSINKVSQSTQNRNSSFGIATNTKCLPL